MSERKNETSLLTPLLDSYEKIGAINHLDGSHLPVRESVSAILAILRELLFPGFFELKTLTLNDLAGVTEKKIKDVQRLLTEEIRKSLCYRSERPCGKTESCKKQAQNLTQDFLGELPALREILKKDLQANFEGDPAAVSEDEVLLSYPGFQALSVFRLAHFLYQKQVPLIPRMMTEIAHSETGIDIHPGAQIGHYFCIDHGTGIVIGETAVIGQHVKLYQGVTIGALSVGKSALEEKRHPTIEDQVTVYAGTTILGGQTVIGAHSIIGGNVWLTASVPPNSKIYLSADRKQVQEPRSER